jgi:cobalt-zinc-cadmium efflux system outer membrane protein
MSASALGKSLAFLIIAILAMPSSSPGQSLSDPRGVVNQQGMRRSAAGEGLPEPTGTRSQQAISAAIARYYDVAQGASSNDLVRRALASNAELAAVRLDLEPARARLTQAGLRSNPTIEFEQTTGGLTGSAGERETSIGLALPLEIGGKRQRRIDLARAELEATEAEVADRERRLIAEVRSSYAEALAALRELSTTEELNNIDQQTAHIVQARVTEGESSPLELNLLRVEVDRLRSRRALVEGRLQAALLRLKALAGASPDEPLRLREDLSRALLPEPPASIEAAVDIALRTRPDLRFARLTEQVAQAGLRLARAQAALDVTAFGKYTQNRSIFDDTPVGALRDKDRLLSFGVSIGIPVFNRNQGAKAEAETAILQARRRREFIETMVRSEVASAYARYEAANTALAAFEQGVLARSVENIRSIRGAYELGAFRLTDLLAEQRRFVDSQREFTETLAERYRALADLQAAVGSPIIPDKQKNK